MSAPFRTVPPRRTTTTVLQFPEPQFKRIVVPREHGSWGMWSLPLISGAIIGATAANAGAVEAAVWLIVAAAAAFMAYQPIEALLGMSPVKARTDEEKQFAIAWALLMVMISLFGTSMLVMMGRTKILGFALVASLCFGIRFLFGNSRRLRVTKQLLGALGLTSTSAAAYYVISGRINAMAFLLWATTWIFAVAQIEYVQLRMRTPNATSVDKVAIGWKVYALHGLIMLGAVATMIVGKAPALLPIAFIPGLVRLGVWTAQKPARIDFRALGFAELFQSTLFTALVVLAFVARF
jgi:hypothetical protein